MRLLLTIFQNEWRQFLRQKNQLISALLFVLVCLLAIRAGNYAVSRQFVQIDSLRNAYQTDFKKSIARFTDTATPQAKAQSKYAGSPAIVNYRLSQHVIKTPAPLAALSLGLYDIQPWYKTVKWTVDYLETPNVPVSNPMVLFAGNFDLAFVLVYLFPLLVIVYSYGVYADEKETGTIKLVAVQSSDLHRIIIYKLLFRLFMLFGVLLLINTTGFVLAQRRTELPLTVLLEWMGISTAYLLFWFALAYLFITFKLNAAITGLYMISSWLILLIILPSLSNLYVTITNPVPLRDDVTSFRRHEGEKIWGTKPAILVDSFNRNNPQYAAGINIAKDTLHLSSRFVAGYYDLLQRRMTREMASLNGKLERRNQKLASLAQWNPAFNTQQLFNAVSGTHLGSYQQFQQQSSDYQQKWKAFLYRFEMRDKDLLVDDFYRLPVFKYQYETPPVWPILSHLVFVSFLILVFMISGYDQFKKQEM